MLDLAQASLEGAAGCEVTSVAQWPVKTQSASTVLMASVPPISCAWAMPTLDTAATPASDLTAFDGANLNDRGPTLSLFGVERESATLRKARGAFFTPVELCECVVEWAIRSPEDVVLEPSCGEVAFLLSAGTRLRALGFGLCDCSNRRRGVELRAHCHASHAKEGGRKAHVVTNTLALRASPPLRATCTRGPMMRRRSGSEGAAGAAAGRWGRRFHCRPLFAAPTPSSIESMSLSFRSTAARPSKAAPPTQWAYSANGQHHVE